MTMKINKLWFILAFLLSSPLLAQYGAVNGQCSVGNVKAVTQGLNSTNTLMGSYPSCTVTVYDYRNFKSRNYLFQLHRNPSL